MSKPICKNCQVKKCENCLSNPKNKLYTPKDAVRAMLAGNELFDQNGYAYFWDNTKFGFWRNTYNPETKEVDSFPVTDFSDLFKKLYFS